MPSTKALIIVILIIMLVSSSAYILYDNIIFNEARIFKNV